jgi:N-carbamoyl-L-amino-acid hydrolase
MPGLCVDDIAALRRDPARYLGFVEVHIEQGPVLNELDLPLGVVTSINGSVRYLGEVIGMASHAGTTPMDRRRMRCRRGRAGAVRGTARHERRRQVGTIGILQVPNGSINVVPGRCQFTLDLRAPTDAAARRDGRRRAGELAASASAAAVHHTLRRRCARLPHPARPLATALGTRCQRLGVPAAPHAQRRRPRRHEAARNHAPGHAVRARRERRHQPQPAGKHHQRRHATGRGRLLQLLDQLATEY